MVNLVRCMTYEPAQVRKAINELIEPLGGMGRFVRPGQRVALKPNILRGADPGDAVTTHPVVVEAVARMVKEAGGSPLVIDSPGAGIPYIPRVLKRIYTQCGYTDIGGSYGLNYDCRFSSVHWNEGKIMRGFEVLTPVLEADCLINLPKVKSHGFTLLSCAVKNLFGVVPGLHKSAYHGKFRDERDFGLMLIDLCQFLKPALTICDGIVGMEGDGPSWGRRRPLGIVAASPDPFLLDLLICRLIGFDPHMVSYMESAIHEGLCPETLGEVDLAEGMAEAISAMGKPFAPPRMFRSRRFMVKVKTGILLRLVCPFFDRILRVTPVVNTSLCKGCGVCVKSCPGMAIDLEDHKARIDTKRCILCFCCHELCPHNAIMLREAFGAVKQVFRRI